MFFVNRCSNPGGRHSPSASHGKYRIGQQKPWSASGMRRMRKGENGRREGERERVHNVKQIKSNQVCAFYTSMVCSKRKFVSPLFPRCFLVSYWKAVVVLRHCQRLSKLGHGIFRLPEIPGERKHTFLGPRLSPSISIPCEVSRRPSHNMYNLGR